MVALHGAGEVLAPWQILTLPKLAGGPVKVTICPRSKLAVESRTPTQSKQRNANQVSFFTG
jgi:hypothetical protein